MKLIPTFVIYIGASVVMNALLVVASSYFFGHRMEMASIDIMILISGFLTIFNHIDDQSKPN